MKSRNSLVAQWLGLCVLTAKGPALIPGLGTRIPQTMGYGQKKNKTRPHTHTHTMDEIQLISDFCLFFSFPSVEDFMTVILSRSRLVPELIPLSSVVLSS